MNQENRVGKRGYAGLFLVTLATLMYEILLTRIFSATMWYHFAFVAISVAMFGMTVGALAVYLRPAVFAAQRAKRQMALSAALFGVTVVLSLLTQLAIPFMPDTSLAGLYSVALTYVVVSVPFVFSGVCVCVALTKFPAQVSRLYAADLAGAAFGCMVLIYVLEITDALTAVFVVAFCGMLGALLFASDGGHGRLQWFAWICSFLLLVFVVEHTKLARAQRPWLRLVWVTGGRDSRPVYETWNSFSRLRVTEDPASNYKLVVIDTIAATALVPFDGDTSPLAYLHSDISNVAHHLRRDGAVLVVGSGGGKDILSALAFDQREVVGVEMNEDILDILNRRYGEFTGHLDRHPRVTFVNDEARSYITRSKDAYDIIQISLIDTWAATAAGAFVLSENSLYTVEAWTTFLDHLTTNGILTVSRWYFRDRPGETYRVTSLAGAALRRVGVANPRDHIMIVKDMQLSEALRSPEGIATILVGRSPFSEQDVRTVEELAKSLNFEMVLTPREAIDPVFAQLASGKGLKTFYAIFPVNITPPTDNSPFFFNMLRLRDVFHTERWRQGVVTFNMKAVVVLAALLATVFGLTFLCIIVPLVMTTGSGQLRGSSLLFVYFAAIGFGFMLVEISQMQRLIVFLGHPTYGLSVVLFALLLSSGLGSYLTGGVEGGGLGRGGMWRLIALLGVLIVFGLFGVGVMRVFQAATTPVRILVAVAILFPIGLFMGMAFPLGMKLASVVSPAVAPWLWGINGATSVCASVLAVAIALGSGISQAFWTGFACYSIAAATFALAVRAARREYQSRDR